MELLSLLLLAASLLPLVTAQGVLVDGNSQLPECAQGCTPLIQAAQACTGTDVATQQTWNCFCQSNYLVTLRQSAIGVCDTACTNPTDNAQISTWYNSNCGDDFGATAHADDGTGTAAGGEQTVTDPETGDTTTVATQPSATGSTSTSQSQSGNAAGASNPGDWWSNHYEYVIMLIILVIGFALIAWGAVWLKRRHDRKQDQITSGFNAGVSGRRVNDSRPEVAVAESLHGSGRDSPARTREAFMPYGYGYSRSASRNNSRADVNERNVHPLSRGQTPMGEMEKNVGTSPLTKGKKVLVREKSDAKSESGGSLV